MQPGDPKPAGAHTPERRCPSCGSPNPGSAQFCIRCARPLTDSEEAVRSELAHIDYLLQELEGWRSRSLLPSTVGQQLQNEYLERQQAILRRLALGRIHEAAGNPLSAPGISPVASQATPPIIPPLPSAPGTVNPPVSLPFLSGPSAAVPSSPETFRSTVTPLHPSPASAPPPRRPGTPPASLSGLRVFLEEHALKIVFAVATLLVLVALRSMFAWEWLGTVAMLLIPAVPLALTGMFFVFGQKTREENPWAAVIYHSLTVALVGFDLLVLNKYVLGGLLHGRLAFLAASVLCLAASGGFLVRWKEIPYLHLFQTCVVLLLYAALQRIRPSGAEQDFRPIPVWLFSGAFLTYAALCLVVASVRRQRRAQDDGANDDEDWVMAWRTWSHIAVTLAIVQAALGAVVGQTVGLYAFAPLALAAGAIYLCGAQLLNDDGMVYVGSLFLLAAVGLWQTTPGVSIWPSGGMAMLALGAGMLGFAALNGRRESAEGEPGGLTRAFRHVAIGSTAIATLLLWFGTVGLMVTSVRFHRAPDAFADAAIALISGLFFGVFAHWEAREEYLYATLSSWASGLVCLLAAFQAPTAVYALTLALYGTLLSATPIVLAARMAAATPASRNGLAAHIAVDWSETIRISGQVATGLGVLIGALLPLRLSLITEWHWLLATFVVGAVQYGFAARRNRSTEAVYAALGCVAYGSAILTWRVLPQSFSLVTCLSPYALVSAMMALFLAQRKDEGAPQVTAGQTAPDVVISWREEVARLWQEPLVLSSLFVVLLALGDGIWKLGIGAPLSALSLLLAPAILAAAINVMALRHAERESLRTCAMVALCVVGMLEIAVASGLKGGLPAWTGMQLRAMAEGWVLLAIFWWGFGQLCRRTARWERLANGLTANGLATVLCSTAVITFASFGSPGAAMALPEALAMELCLAASFGLFSVDLFTRREESSLRLSLFVAFGALLANLIPPTSPEIALVASTLFALGMAATYLGLARRRTSLASARLSLYVSVAGYAIAWRLRDLCIAQRLPVFPADILWLIGGLALSWAYAKTARWSLNNLFTYASALVLTITYLHVTVFMIRIPAEWQALALLPFVTALYITGVRFAGDEDALQGAPWRHTAYAASVFALTCCVGIGDNLFRVFSFTASPWSATCTLLAYGVAFTALVAFQRTAVTVAACACALTGGYLNYLFSRTPILGAPGPAQLPWHFVLFLTLQPGILWLAVAWYLRRTPGGVELAAPLLRLTGALAFGGALLALGSLRSVPPSLWLILTFAWAGALWFGLWAMDQGELCLHSGTVNLIIAWGLIVHDYIGAEITLLDLYLLPVGLYLIFLGHVASNRQQREKAQQFWGTGLLLIMTPTFLAYWERAPFWHTLLLLVECLLSVLWGIGQRIRAFVYAGAGFTVLFAASATLGHLPDMWGTLASLGLGVGLFVLGFYALTHRDQVQKWATAFEHRWQAWKAWR